MTPEDFTVLGKDVDGVVRYCCPICPWVLRFDEKTMWNLLNEARDHLLEEH